MDEPTYSYLSKKQAMLHILIGSLRPYESHGLTADNRLINLFRIYSGHEIIIYKSFQNAF